MSNPTSNFGWQMPTPTDLVTDLPADFEVFGQAVDTSLADLKGGTSGQVLSKNSNTDMDFVWVTSDDANAIQNTIVDAKGDLIAASAADTPARLAVGANGETLVADSSTSTGLRYQANFAAGKNAIINGAFDNWQRGTSFTLSSGPVNTYCADRFVFEAYGSSTAATVTRQTFTPGAAPVAGYEGQYFARLTNFATASAWQIRQRIEDVRTFAGQTVTFSFWAKASTAVSGISYQTMQNFGSGGSGAVTVDIATGQSFTTSWARYSVTTSIASITGKTVGTGSYLEFNFYLASGATNSGTIDTWGWQVEAGSVATAFETATGTIQGELAACQRYYQLIASGTSQLIGTGYYFAAAQVECLVNLPVEMRTKPTISIVTGTGYYSANSSGGGADAINSLTIGNETTSRSLFLYNDTQAAGTAGQGCRVQTNNAAAFIAVQAEL